MIHDVIEIDKELIPYEFDILLADETFKIGINYNNTPEVSSLVVYERVLINGTWSEFTKVR